MAFDYEGYRRNVLEPARKRGNVVPANLLARYALSPGLMRNDAQFHEHVTEVEKYWRRLLTKQTYKALANALLIAHSQLHRSGALKGIESFRGYHDQEVRDGQQRLRLWADGVKDSATCVARERVEAWLASHGGPLGFADAKKVLDDRGVKVSRPFTLPSGPPPKFGDLAKNVNALGLVFSVEVVDKAELARGFAVLNGFRFTRPGARALDQGTISKAKDEYTGRRDERNTAANNVLSILLAKATRPRGLDELFLWESIEAVRRSMEGGLSQRMLAEVAVAFGLVRDEADILSMTLFEARGTATTPGLVLEIEALLGAGELRAAERLAAGLSETADERVKEVAERVQGLTKRVAGLAADADRARSEGQTEEAAQRLAEALHLVTDDPDLRTRLAAIPPPPATTLRLAAEDGVVKLSWDASHARTGKIRYRVVRRVGQPATSAEQGTVIDETERLVASDDRPGTEDALFGQPLHYSVFAARSEGTWSSPARANPLVVTPDVTDLQLVSDAISISGSWRVSPRSVDVVVVRKEHHPPATPTDGLRVRAPTRGAFTDGDVQTGTRYFYRVSAVYVTPTGKLEIARGIVASAVPESALTAVTDLKVRMLDGEGSPTGEVVWTVPRDGTVSIHLADRPSPWAAGTAISPAELAAFGRPVGGTPTHLPDGQASLRLPPLTGRCYVTAATCGSAHALVGNTVELRIVASVSEVGAQRLGESVRLSWVWPPEITTALVRWRPQAANAGDWHEGECSRRSYRDSGGFTIAAGPEAYTVVVHAVIKAIGDDALGVPVTVAVPGLRTRLRYSIRRESRWRRSRATVELRADSPCTTPRLIVIYRAGAVMPTTARQGEEIGRIAPRALDPGTSYSQTFEVPAARGVSWVVCLPEDDASDVVLVPPPINELRAG